MGDGSSLVTNATANTNGYFSLYNPPPFFPAGRDYSGANATDTVVQRAGFLLQDVLSYGQWRFLAGVRGDAHFSLDNNYAFAWSPRFGITRMFRRARKRCSPMQPVRPPPTSGIWMKTGRN